MALRQEDFITPEEYLEIDRASQDVKYEYIDGHMYAMSGGTADHARIAYNMANLLDTHLENGPCRFFQSDVRVRVAEKKYFYPDVTVSCNPEDQQGSIDVVHFPRLIVEVLSSSTEARDRRKKFIAYQACPSVQEYVLVNTQCQMVEVFRRQADEEIWLYRQFRPGQEVELVSVAFTFPTAALYRLTDVPAEEERTDDWV